MDEQSNSNLDKFNYWIKNNKVTAFLIAFGTIIIALSTFTDAARNLMDLLIQEKRPEINGEWTAEITYDWAHATYTETFSFEGEGEEISGTASFLKIKRAITEGIVNDNKVKFVTRTKEVGSSWNEGDAHETIHRYTGIMEEDKIQFTLQTEGGILPHVPIKFIARKVSETTE